MLLYFHAPSFYIHIILLLNSSQSNCELFLYMLLLGAERNQVYIKTCAELNCATHTSRYTEAALASKLQMLYGTTTIAPQRYFSFKHDNAKHRNMYDGSREIAI